MQSPSYGQFALNTFVPVHKTHPPGAMPSAPLAKTDTSFSAFIMAITFSSPASSISLQILLGLFSLPFFPAEPIFSSIFTSSSSSSIPHSSSVGAGAYISSWISGSSTGAFFTISARVLLIYAESFALSSFVFVAEGFISSRLEYIPSSVLYVRSNDTAVFCPIPATPGILSEESPMSALQSTNCSGAIPYSETNVSLSNSTIPETPFFVYRTVVLSFMSWRESLSPVTRYDFISFALAFAESVPSMSSASKPSALRTVIPNFFSSSFNISICDKSCSGVLLLPAL